MERREILQTVAAAVAGVSGAAHLVAGTAAGSGPSEDRRPVRGDPGRSAPVPSRLGRGTPDRLPRRVGPPVGDVGLPDDRAGRGRLPLRRLRSPRPRALEPAGRRLRLRHAGGRSRRRARRARSPRRDAGRHVDGRRRDHAVSHASWPGADRPRGLRVHRRDAVSHQDARQPGRHPARDARRVRPSPAAPRLPAVDRRQPRARSSCPTRRGRSRSGCAG